MTDKEIIEGLITRDAKITQQFFFRDCRPLFRSIIRHVFSYEVDYDEFVNEFYIHLLENSAHRLRLFGGRCSLYQWIKIVAIRYFIHKRNRLIDMTPEKMPIEDEENEENDEIVGVYEENENTAKMDVKRLFELMPNKRYVYILQKLMLEDQDPKQLAEEMHITVANLYNIKRRAMAALTKIALNKTE